MDQTKSDSPSLTFSVFVTYVHILLMPTQLYMMMFRLSTDVVYLLVNKVSLNKKADHLA